MIEKVAHDHVLNEETFEVACDKCSNWKEFEVFSWADLMIEMKNNGWHNENKGGEWFHYCINCQAPTNDL